MDPRFKFDFVYINNNYCFVNNAVQCILSIPKIVSIANVKSCGVKDCLVCVLNGFNKDPRIVIDLREEYLPAQLISEILPGYVAGSQSDSDEFLSCFFSSD